MRKRELIALLNLSSWCLVMVERLFLAVPRGCLQFVIVVFPDHTHLLFLPKSFKQIEFHDIFGLSNVIDAVINLWNWKCVHFGDRIYFRVVLTHAKCPTGLCYKNTRRAPFTLTRFYKVIIQLILNFFSENLLFDRVPSVWMLFHRF